MLSNPGGNNLANVTESFQGLSQQLAQVPNNLFPAISGKLPDICFANFSKALDVIFCFFWYAAYLESKSRFRRPTRKNFCGILKVVREANNKKIMSGGYQRSPSQLQKVADMAQISVLFFIVSTNVLASTQKPDTQIAITLHCSPRNDLSALKVCNEIYRQFLV